MKSEKNMAPEILTGKDLDYLKDIFGWNYTLYKLGINSIECVEDEEIKVFYEDCTDFFYENMKEIINIIKEEENE